MIRVNTPTVPTTVTPIPTQTPTATQTPSVPQTAPVATTVPDISSVGTTTGSTTTTPTPAPPPPSSPSTISHTCGTPINVPADTLSVQIALDSACSGDTVYLAAGVYRENINVKTNGVTLKGAATRETVIIDGGNLDGVLSIQGADVNKFTIEGLTLQNGGGGTPANPKARNVDNGLSIIGSSGGPALDINVNGLIIKDNKKNGIQINNAGPNARIVIRNTLIAHNVGDGIVFANGDRYVLEIYESTIADNGQTGIHNYTSKETST